LDGGYDEGYRACPCFWGDKPGSLVAQLLIEQNFAGKFVLDLGCGEGKNAAAFARAGASVTAIDCSELAISNGKAAFRDLEISCLASISSIGRTTAVGAAGWSGRV